MTEPLKLSEEDVEVRKRVRWAGMGTDSHYYFLDFDNLMNRAEAEDWSQKKTQQYLKQILQAINGYQQLKDLTGSDILDVWCKNKAIIERLKNEIIHPYNIGERILHLIKPISDRGQYREKLGELLSNEFIKILKGDLKK